MTFVGRERGEVKGARSEERTEVFIWGLSVVIPGREGA